MRTHTLPASNNNNAASNFAAQQLAAPVANPQPAMQTLPASNTSKPVSSLRAKRIAALQVACYAKRVASKQAKHAAATNAAKQAAYLVAVQQLAAQYGVPVPTQAVRSVPTQQRFAPSSKPGACKQVHAICAANPTSTRAQVLALCYAAGINPATASTQYALYRKAQQH